MKTIGLVVGGVGVAGLALGSIFGAMSMSKWSSAQSDCKSATDCTNHAQALSDKDAASSNATISTVAFVGGGIALAAGAALFFLAPAGGGSSGTALRVAPSVGPGSAGAVVKGVF
jgi:hypothetical protein